MNRMMVGQRKGAPTTGGEQDGPKDVQETPDPELVQCPQCQCVFDSKEHQAPDDAEPTDYANGGDEQPQGAELELPPGSAAQAPAGENALTQTLAAVLGGGR